MKRATMTLWTDSYKKTGEYSFVILWDDGTWEEVKLPYSNVTLKPYRLYSCGKINHFVKPYQIAKDNMNYEEAHEYIKKQIARFEEEWRAPY